jgi:hypothetical protein
MSLDAAVMDLSGAFEYEPQRAAFARLEWAPRVHPEVLAKDFEFRAASEALEALYNRDELRQSYSGTIKQSAASSPCLVTAGLNGRSSAKAITGNPISVATNIASLTSPRSLLACRLQSLSRQLCRFLCAGVRPLRLAMFCRRIAASAANIGPSDATPVWPAVSRAASATASAAYIGWSGDQKAQHGQCYEKKSHLLALDAILLLQASLRKLLRTFLAA